MRMTRARSRARAGRGWKSMYVMVFTVFFVMSICFSSLAQEVKYHPDGECPYSYGLKNPCLTKENVQFKLMVRIDKPEEFKRMFESFNRVSPEPLDINWILKNGQEDTYLTTATALKHWEIVPYLLSKGIDVDHQDSHKGTALMYAAYCGHLPTVGRLIIEGDADMIRCR